MKQHLLRIYYFIGLAFLATLIASCSTLHEANQNIADNKARVDQANETISQSAPAAISDKGYYVNQTPIKNSDEPKWLKQNIDVTAKGMPFNLLVARILRNAPVNVTYDQDMDPSQMVNFSYRGSIKGALNALAADTNLAYQVNGSDLDWSSLITRTFNIPFMPGSSNYMVGQNPSENSSGSSAASGSGDIVTVKGNLGNSQYSNLQAQLSVWQDLRNSLNQLKSKDGKVWISESTTTVTVQDHPSNVRAMASYIKKLNQIMTEQVSIRVTVLELNLDKDYNYGIDWNVVQAALGTRFSLNGNTGSSANLSGALAQASGNTGLFSLTVGDATSNAIMRALSTQGELSVVTQPTVVTMNNQVAEIRITQDTGFLQSISVSQIANAGSQTSLTPGVVTDGFSLYLLPKIQGDNVYLQISSTLSNLVNLQEVNNKGLASNQVSASALQNQDDFQSIQVPTLAEKHFNQRTVLHSGSTLVITGFQQLRDQTRTVSPYGATIIGGKGARRNNVQTIVLITPSIVRGNA